MAFSRKNKRVAEAAGAGTIAESEGGGVAVATAQKKRKPAEMLSSVVKESTAGAAVALLRENKPFALPNNKSWVVLGLAVQGIGGLSMKQKNDEAKGSIIELITADEITTVATLDMLAMETFGIIPSAKSLGRMDEFSLLKNAEYLWVVMSQTPEGILSADPVAKANYTQAVDICEGRSSIAQILPEIWAWGGGETVDGMDAGDASAAASGDEPLAEDLAGSFDEDNPFGDTPLTDDEDPIDYSALAEEADVEINDESGVDFGEFEKQFAEEDSADGNTPQYEQDDRVVDEEEVRASIARRFLSSDLDLVVDLETFEANFSSDAPIVAFPVDEDTTDWLGRQVNQLARQANTEMEQLHTHNQDQLRELWVSLMSQHVEQVIVDVSTDREGTWYHSLLNAAKQDLADRRQKGPEEAAALRREMMERYESEAAARGRQAAEQAVTRYKDQNRPRLERELAEVGLASERASEEFYDGAQQIILETRRRDAMARMDLGATKVIDVLIELQQTHREAEEELLRGWSEEMKQVVDVYRKDDIARSEVLAKQLKRDNALEAVNAEHAARLADIRAEQADRVEQLNREMQKIRSDAMSELDAREQTWQQQLSVEKQNATHANSRVKELLDQFDQINNLRKDQHELQVASLQADKESYSQELDRSHKVQSRANILMALLVLVVALACLAVGFIFGAGAGSPSAASAAGAAVAWLSPGIAPSVF